MKQIREVLRLHLLANLSARKIQGATGVARTTIQEYIKRCNESDISSVESLDKLSDDILNEKLFGIISTTISPNPSKVMPDYNAVHQEMKRKKKQRSLLCFYGKSINLPMVKKLMPTHSFESIIDDINNDSIHQ